MQKRTRIGLLLAALAAVLAGGVFGLMRWRQAHAVARGALDAIPSGALLVATLDVPALRASPVGAPFFREEREIPGLGKVRDVCGFDPMAGLTEVAIGIPVGGDSGEFGLSAAGDIQDEALLACASKVIEARGGRPVVTQVGSFQTVRDASLTTPGGEIAVRAGGPVLLGGGAYLRAMIDSADGRSPSIRESVAHNQLARQVGGGAARVSLVLTPEQRAQLADDLALSGGASSPAASILAGGVGVALGPEIAVHAVIACTTEGACAELGKTLQAARDARTQDFATRIVGFGPVLERVEFRPEGTLLHLRVALSAQEAGVLADRLVALRGLRHPMPEPKTDHPADGADAAPRPDASDAGAIAPDELVEPPPRDAGGGRRADPTRRTAPTRRPERNR